MQFLCICGSASVVPHLYIQPTTDRVVFTIEKTLSISGPVQVQTCVVPGSTVLKRHIEHFLKSYYK